LTFRQAEAYGGKPIRVSGGQVFTLEVIFVRQYWLIVE
jgi:hypothetical protein